MAPDLKERFTGTALYFQILFWLGVTLILILLNDFTDLNILLLSGLSAFNFYVPYCLPIFGNTINTKKQYVVYYSITFVLSLLAWYYIDGGQMIWVALYFIFISVFSALLSGLTGNKNSSKDMELNLLKSQFSPHFLFNTLNIIYSKCHITSPEAATMIQNLSAFMRYLSNECAKDKVLLQKEIGMLHDYITLYKGNYNNNLNIKFIHKLYDTEQKVAPMLLLNFVENAFKHSHIALKQEAYVTIELATDQTHLHFKVTNNKAAAINQLEKGIGNSITLKQLELTYKDRYEYAIRETDKEYEVFLKIRL